MKMPGRIALLRLLVASLLLFAGFGLTTKAAFAQRGRHHRRHRVVVVRHVWSNGHRVTVRRVVWR